jgi:hypothetical protein
MIKKLVTTLLILIFLVAGDATAWTLMWDNSTGTVEGYLVEISDDNGETWKYIYATDTPGLNLDDKAAFNRTYMFRVSAFNAAGVSAPTEPLTWTRPAYTPPAENPLPVVNNGPANTPTNTTVN